MNRAQPRAHFDETALEELKISLKTQGMLQPLIVRAHESGGYELVAGERRLRAALLGGLTEVPVVVRETEAEELLELALVENIQREDLNPVEEARAYRNLLQQNSLTQKQLAERLGKSRSTLANSLRLLELPEPIQESLARGRITAGHAKLLLSVEAPEVMVELHRSLLEEGWTVRELERRVHEAKPSRATPSSVEPRRAEPGRGKPPHVTDQEELLSQALGTRVEIREGDGRGKIVIDYYSADDYERLRAIFLAPPRQP